MSKQKRTKRSMPFEEAREFIRSQCIGSRKQYSSWYELNQPKKLPKYPNRAYVDEWKGWNDFLGTNNKFDKTLRTYRPFPEALAWANTLGLSNVDEWLDYYKENRDKVPEDIPGRPDLIYDDWLSWMHWLGNKPRQKVEAQQKVQKESAVFYIVQERDYANQSTVFTFGINRGGVSGLKDRWELSKDFRVIKMFEYDESEMSSVYEIINTQSTPFYGMEKVRIVPNINQVIWDISNHLMFARLPNK